MSTLSPSEVTYLTSYATSYLYSRGCVFVSASRDPKDGVIHVPFSLLPWRYPRALLEQGLSLAVPFNTLVDAVSRNSTWLLTTLGRVAEADEFTGRLVEMHRAEVEEGERAAAQGRHPPPQNPLRLGLHRSDYMLTAHPTTGALSLKQVELNTVASSMGGLSTMVSGLHAHLAARFSQLPGVAAHFTQGGGGNAPPTLTPSTACKDLAGGLAAAHHAYLKGYRAPPLPPHPVCVAMVVQPGERNVYDQRALEGVLWEEHGVVVRYVTLAELGELASSSSSSSSSNSTHQLPPYTTASAPPLLLPQVTTSTTATATATTAASASTSAPPPPFVEVSVVYYRAGYTPSDYPTPLEWAGRAWVEGSRAIKCPCLAYHLVGTKKVQQALAVAGGVEAFLPPSTAASLRQCFAGLWSLDPGEESSGGYSASARAHAAAHPHLYVIKPQREGGGNNLYGEEVRAALSSPPPPSSGGEEGGALCGHILMERLFPPLVEGVQVRGGVAVQCMGSCELGVYGVFLGDGGQGPPLINAPAGTLLRTKREGSDEGGVAAGFAVIDSVLPV
jgi:hypothetical protein